MRGQRYLGYRLAAHNESGLIKGAASANKTHVLAQAISSFQAEIGGKMVPKQLSLTFSEIPCSRVYSAYLNYMDNAGAQKET